MFNNLKQAEEVLSGVADKEWQRQVFAENDARLEQVTTQMVGLGANSERLDAYVGEINEDVLFDLTDGEKLTVALALFASVAPDDVIVGVLKQYSLEASVIAQAELNSKGLVPVVEVARASALRILKGATEIDIENFSAAGVPSKV